MRIMSQTGSDPVTAVKNADGDLVLDYTARVGAHPYARYSDGEWDVISLTHVPTPTYGSDAPDTDHGIDTTVHTVVMEPDDVSEQELREMAQHSRYPDDDTADDAWPGVDVIAYDESPFPHRDDIPARDDIVRMTDCPQCGGTFRQYLPDPFDTCPHCGATINPTTSDQ